MNKLTLRQIDVNGKRVLVRVDYNVPVKDGVVGDTLRITASFPTIKYLLDRGCSVVLMSHLGEPKGAPEDRYTLKPVAEKASELLGRHIEFISDCVGSEVDERIAKINPGEIILLENVRFHQEELDNDAVFGKKLATHGEVFVNDAFAVDHRKQASVVAVTEYLPSVAGLLVEKEIDTITAALDTPKRPLIAIVGGAKVSSKLDVLNNMMEKVNVLMLGGAMANTFFLAMGENIGRSLAEPDLIAAAKKVLASAKKHDVEVILPQEVVVSKSIERPEDVRRISIEEVADDDFILDVGKEFATALKTAISQGGTIIWNGPVGLTELPEFSEGSRAIAEVAIASGAQTIIGGGDTAAFVDNVGLHDRFSWVSTGGGASLELMSGKKLPGIEALMDVKA
ncbi:MAG: phosphoglycerate kinase [Candidatus Saccharibacteria bacterium]